MTHKLTLLCLIFLFIFTLQIDAQKRGRGRSAKSSAAVKKQGKKAVVIDERLAVLRVRPSLYARPVQRMRRGREVLINGSKEADGVIFYRVVVPPNNKGWVQAEAVTGNFRRGDDARLAFLIQASEGFDRIERASIFLKTFPGSEFRPLILLLFGDLLEEEAIKLSRRATRSFDRSEMAASGAPLHSFYLNYSRLGRYRKLGVVFLFNQRTKQYHYDGAVWRELVRKFPKSDSAIQARKRLADLKGKLSK